ncbi:CrcB family protein [Bacillus sp. FJAT-42376]|uniref:fluoride efflux transporter FluC n=1 Tax=Bacillus sp. FJAT-42376 TaxID=2014076 RepID=UPI000F4FE233|nr:CrcB family protein [Bacillus sp. FJAT-42376]AZB42128.1 CrcB family protein [Bacillus sp. FJAT-42376]
MISYFYIAIGGFLGAISRYAVSQKWNGPALPYGTLFVNLAGAFLIGCLAGVTPSETVYLLAATGFLGGFTTFSTMNLELAKQVMEKKYRAFLIYGAITYIGGILLAYAGFLLTGIR